MDIEKFIPIIMFIVTIGGIIATHFKAKGMDEAQQKIIDDKLKELYMIDEKQWKEIDKGKEWEIRHEKEAWENRNSIELKVAVIEGENKKLESIMKSVEAKLDALIERLGK